jgi:pimeloyl-ACP methyl ester carboxylesterase
MGEDCTYFAHQATSLHQLDPDMLAAVLKGPASMVEGYEPEVLLPAITCPVLLMQADPAQGSALPDDEVKLALKLLRHATHVRMDGLTHALHAPPGGTQRVLEVFRPFVESLPSLTVPA